MDAATIQFRKAVSSGDGTEALRYGRQILYQCQGTLEKLGPAATQEAMHYQTIAAETAQTLRTMGITDIEQDLHVFEPESRPAEIVGITDRLNHVSTLLTAISDLIFRAEPAIAAYNRTINDDAIPTIDRANDSLILHYADATATGGCSVACVAAWCRRNPMFFLCFCGSILVMLTIL